MRIDSRNLSQYTADIDPKNHKVIHFESSEKLTQLTANHKKHASMK